MKCITCGKEMDRQIIIPLYPSGRDEVVIGEVNLSTEEYAMMGIAFARLLDRSSPSIFLKALQNEMNRLSEQEDY